ncbi:MAG TPA: NAD(P)-dependent alcohol dehydrogenase [Gaiellaceae bacterium]|nr:NAD(P)-dependent alcohol dehydrogenase [Gaiellaceae bacterium]
MRATAAVTEATGAPFELRELELGDPRPDEVVVRVAASGICHTDLICRDQWYPVPLPAVLGHEGAGIVERVGSAVTKVAPGDRVGMTFHSCGRCETCQTGKPAYCHAFFEHNFASSRPADGSSAFGDVHAHFFGQSSFATLSLANERNVVKLPASIPLEVAAPFGCGIQTGAGAVLNSVAAPAGSSIAVFGTGTVGCAAILGAVVAGCTTIVGVDVRPARLELARALGATHVVDGGEGDAVEAIRALTNGGADFALETTASAAVLRSCVDCLAPTGVAGVIGAPAFGTEVSLDVNTILTGGRVVRGIVEGDSIPDVFLPRLVRLWEQGRFPVERLMTFYDFDQIEQAAHDAESGAAVKAVLRMQ